jgi:pyrroloquinoline quinone biosynthesis protein B
MERRSFLTALLAGAFAPAALPSALRSAGPGRVVGSGAASGVASDLEALVLGSVQDAGLPQPGCYTERCDRGRELLRSGTPRYVASLALIEPAAGRFHLVDATPDLTRQIDLISHPAFRRRAAARDPFDGIFLTHAHIGHYLGLALLGNEGTGIRDTPVYCTDRMARFLAGNGPWSLMVEQGRIVPTPLAVADPTVPVAAPEGWHRMDPGLEVKLLDVPHRDEYTDTVAFVFRRPGRGGREEAEAPGPALLYLPDIDGWERWDRDLRAVVDDVDVAFLDATFHSADELPGRTEEEIPHPLVPRTMDRLQAAVDAGLRVVLTHLNNSNPLLDDGGPERRRVETRGFEVAREGMRVEL